MTPVRIELNITTLKGWWINHYPTGPHTIFNFERTTLRVGGIEPPYSDRKSDGLTTILYPHLTREIATTVFFKNRCETVFLK